MGIFAKRCGICGREFCQCGRGNKGDKSTSRKREIARGIPTDEAIGVRQLLREGLLTRGGVQQVTRGLSKVLAVAVVVPKRTRLIAHRWASLHKPAAWLVESRGDDAAGVPS